MHSTAAFAKDGTGVAKKTGLRLLISAAKPRDFKALPRQCQMTPTTTGQGEEET
jgi:hypothetical protein